MLGRTTVAAHTKGGNGGNESFSRHFKRCSAANVAFKKKISVLTLF